ncbi:MAG: hypothetical protein AAFP28_03345 [Pseudomonadota bacterium]
MFQGFGFLVGEIWLLLALAILLGLFAGWLIWNRSSAMSSALAEASQLRADLDQCRAMHGDKDTHIRTLEAEISTLRTAARPGPVTIARAPKPAKKQAARPGPKTVKPATLSAPRGGRPDNLQRIKGIGPALERLCNSLGFFHFDQIAKWSNQEIAWVDANLEGFSGRVLRDGWVDQARKLAAEASS